MKRFSHILLGAALNSAPILSPHAQAAPPVEPAELRQALASPTRFRASVKCLRNPQCRKSVVEWAKKLRDRWTSGSTNSRSALCSSFTTLLGDVIGVKGNKDAIASIGSKVSCSRTAC